MNFIKSALGLPWLVCTARLVYMSRLYRKTSAERLSLVQVSWIKPIIRPIPEDLSRKPRPEMHFGAQVRLVHHGIIWKRAKEPQLIDYSLSLSSTSSMIKPIHPNPFTGGNNEIPKSFPDSGRRRNSGNDCISLTFEVCCTSKLNSPAEGLIKREGPDKGGSWTFL